MKFWFRLLFITAVVGGVFLSVMYINPYGGKITLSEATLQLSGSRGEFDLGFSLDNLAAFAARLLPAFLFEMYAGILLYQHFCTASIYVFSRYPHRVKWYIRKAFQLGGAVCAFQMLLLAAAMLTAICRFELRVDSAGIVLLTYHFLIHSLWIYSMTLLINLSALYIGSSAAYVTVNAAQLVCIVLLYPMDLLVRCSDGRITYGMILKWNPVAHLILGWHGCKVGTVERLLESSRLQIDLNHSLVILILFGSFITSAGALIVRKHNLLISDSEMGAA